MTKTEAKELVVKISSTFPNSKFDSVRRQVYADVLEKMDFNTAARAIDRLILNNRFCPTIAEIHETYQTIQKNERLKSPVMKQLKSTCPVCAGFGYLVKHKEDESDYIYHCECQAGQRWAYDGTKLKENPSDFFIPSITSLNTEGGNINAASNEVMFLAGLS